MKNRILRSALSVALCAAMLLSQGLTAFAENEIVPSPNNEGNSAAAEFSLLEEKAGEPSVTDGENVPETPASTEDETKTETTTGQPTAEDDTAKETTAKTPAVVNEEEKSEEATAAPAEAQAATNSLKGWGDCDRPSNQPTKGCHPDPIPLPNKSDVIAALPGFSFDCENSNCNASESIELKDLVFTIGEVNRKAGTVDITFDNAAFSTSLAKFNEKCGKHNLAKEQPIVVTLTWNAKKDYWYYAGNEQNIIVPVECSFPSNNVPAVPTYKDLEELLGNMTVYCVNENHLVSKAYPITWNTIGGLNQKPVQNDDGTFSMEITVSYDPFKDLFDDEFGPHDYVENIELARSVVSLKWSKDVGTWIVDGSFINSFNVICDTTSGGGEDPGTNPGGGDNGNNGGNNNGNNTGGGSSVSRRDDDDDWEPLPNNNYRVTKKNDKPSQNTQIVVRDPAGNSDNTSSNTGSDSGKHNPETGDTTTAFAAMALAAVSLGGAVLLGRKKK